MSTAGNLRRGSLEDDVNLTRRWRPTVAAACCGLLAASLALTAQQAAPAPVSAALDSDLLEVSIPRLEAMYAAHRYTVAQVTDWCLARIARYDARYKSLLHVDAEGARATAAAEDAEARGRDFKRRPLWGVPVVIKANTSVKGFVTSTGWKGYLIPGHELKAPIDAPVVARLRGAGAVILGQTNMPDFAASDTNLSSALGRTGNAYDSRFSPGGSSGGTVTAVTANFAVLGTGTDTSNSIRMPSATSAVVGVLPTRGLVSIAGIHPLDWLLDNTGPIARTVGDAAIALGVMAGEDSQDLRTKGSASSAQSGPYTKYLKAGALNGKRFGVPAFIVSASPGPNADGPALTQETREVFLKALDGLRRAGATVVLDEGLLPASFSALTGAINTRPYRREGIDLFLRTFGPAEYHSPEEYEKAVGGSGSPEVLESDPDADATFWGPQRKALAAYEEALKRFHLDGFVYPGLQMPPNDETIPQPGGRPSSGPHSYTGWVNRIGVPAIVVPAGFHANGLPFGLEFSARRWRDGDLLGWAFAFEQATRFRTPPRLVDP
jgi:amidase